MKIPKIIIGSSGQVAASLREAFAKKNIASWSTSRQVGAEHFLDLGQPESIRNFFSSLAKEFPKQTTDIYLAGAMTHVDKCEQEPALCQALNVEGPRIVGEECLRYGHRLCYYSSEYVFGEAEYHGGQVGPFREEDPVAPCAVYAKSKCEAERVLLGLSPNFHPLILRTTMVFSYDANGVNYVMQVLRQLERFTKGDTSISFKVPVDQISTPTYAPALAEASIALLEKKCTGIYHIVGSDLVSRKEFIEKIIAAFDFPKNAVNAFSYLTTADLKQPARRPLTAGLNADKAQREGIKIWSLEESFRDFQQRQKS